MIPMFHRCVTISSVLVFACLASSSPAAPADRSAGKAIPIDVAVDILGSSEGPAAPNAIVFVFEGDAMVAQGITDGEGKFSFTAQPSVSFVDSETGQPRSQAFVSYRIVAFGVDEVGNTQMSHQFKSVRLLPGEAAKSEAWSLPLAQVRSGSHGAIPAPLGAVTPEPDDGIDLGCLLGVAVFPCKYMWKDLGSHLTKVGEVHTTAGASTTFEFGISSAVSVDVAVSYDNFVTASVSSGATWSEELGAVWRLAENNQAVEALSSFQYERRWWRWDCWVFFPAWCGVVWYQTVEPIAYNGGGFNGDPVGGDNLQPEMIPTQWRTASVSPGNSWFKTAETSWYIEAAVGLKVAGLEVSLGARLETSKDTKYTADFDPQRRYDYPEMIVYDTGTNGAVWSFTHRLQKEILAARDETSTAVQLEWSPFGGLDFARYEIWVRRKGLSAWSFHSAITDPNLRSGWFGGLQPATTYQFYVRVKEHSGLYRDTDVVERTTDGGGGRPPGCPRCPPPMPI